MKLKTEICKNKANFLVSTQSPNEISNKLISEIDILDLKDPSKGSIGSWEFNEINKVVRLLKNKIEISATLGDIYNNKKFREKLNRFDQLNLDFIKFGLLSKHHKNLFEKLRLVSQEKYRTKLVAVIFVDHKKAFDLVCRDLQVFENSRINYLLLDTFKKDSGCLLDFCNIPFLKNFINKCNNYKIKVGLAGGIKESQVPLILSLNPNIIGFRSAVCKFNKRESSINFEKIKKISSYFNSFNSNAITRAGA